VSMPRRGAEAWTTRRFGEIDKSARRRCGGSSARTAAHVAGVPGAGAARARAVDRAREDGWEDFVIEGKTASRSWNRQDLGALGVKADTSYDDNWPAAPGNPPGALHDPPAGPTRGLSDYCSAGPRCLFGAAMIPVADVATAVVEVEVSVRLFGHRIALLRSRIRGRAGSSTIGCASLDENARRLYTRPM
jgi:hypothetical protein